MDETRGKFVLKAPYQPSGDQPQAIEALTKGVNAGMKGQVLLGVTGSGKTFTMASVIAQVQRPTLVIAHNKTLAAQLCSEFRAFFPDSAVEYFVSYYDYYQPEAYIASSDTYIEKDAAINAEIERLCNICRRHDLYLFADEVYKGLEMDGEKRDWMADHYEKCVSLGVMSKAYGLAGLRVGWLVTKDLELLEKVVKFKHYMSISDLEL